ncbi:hypothetical protein Jiend_40600 [Micromonospora endophytica]|nr:hypothetical protein Jiend_40600 [Micromonospora endophytica]
MRLLVLGGTWFVGYAIVTAAVAAGWEVTTFNRGTSDPFLEAVRNIRRNGPLLPQGAVRVPPDVRA